MKTIEFPGVTATLEGWHFAASASDFETDAGRPCVVMAHGVGGTKDSGLAPYAEGLAAAGFGVLAFDYAGFGGSGGDPRQVVSMKGQLDDYRAALEAAKKLPGVDPNRLVLWGVSLAGGHVLLAAGGRTDVAAVIALTPLVDGVAAAALAFKNYPATQLLRSTGVSLKSALRRRGSVLLPLVGEPGSLAPLSLPGVAAAYQAIAGPTWRNQIDASISNELATFRPTTKADQIDCPALFQIADFDRLAPPHASAKAAFKARAEVRHYPCDHFDVFPGSPWFEAALDHQISFLRHHLRHPR